VSALRGVENLYLFGCKNVKLY